MRTKNTQKALQPDPVDCTFDTLFMAQLRAFTQRFEPIFPDQRLFRLFGQLLKGVIASGVPIIAQVAAAVIQSDDPRRAFHVAKRYYRWLRNDRIHHRPFLKPAYALTRQLFSSVKEKFSPKVK
jgi:hypothetical protein